MPSKTIALLIAVSLAGGTTTAVGQSTANSNAVQNRIANSPIDAAILNQFRAFAESNAPQNLDRGGLQLFVDGVIDYIYGYSLLAIAMTERVVTSVPDAVTKLGRAPINQLAKATTLPDSSYSDVVLPSTSTLYASSFMDLSKGPMVLHLPEMPPIVDTGQPRYFIVQLLDGWTNVKRESPSSRLHSRPGDYLLIGPGGTTEPTTGYAGVIKFDTNTVWAIHRFFTDGSPADLSVLDDQVVKNLTLTPLSEQGTSYTPPTNLPVNPSIDTFTQPIEQLDNMDACAFFGAMSTMMMSNPPRDIDFLVQKPLQTLGLLTPSRPFSCASFGDQSQVRILQASVAVAKQLLANINPPSASAATNYWSMALNVGDYGINYILRALVAQKALGANRPEDGVYGYGAFDGRGISDAYRLDGANRYVVHFSPQTNAHRAGEIPPVNAGGFWSVTLYDGNGFLVKNVNMNPDGGYNAIGMPYVQNHKACPNGDGSLDLYVQSDPPSDPKQFCNWLETPLPDGSNASTSKFILFLRMYWPGRSVLNGTWAPPPIVKQ
jgi:DNA sulfur modification protein DndE